MGELLKGLWIRKQGEFDADLIVRIHSLKARSKNMDVLKLKGVPYDVKKMALNTVIEMFEGETYGFIQWLTITIRYFCEWLGFKNAGKWNILWGWGIVCSELVFYYLHNIAIDMSDNYLWNQFRLELQDRNPHLFTPKDIEMLARHYPELFEWDIA